MGMSKFTPGPWSVGVANDTFESDVGIHADDWIIADMCNDIREEYGIDQEANANLIAAAPELYEALENALEVMEDGHQSNAKVMAREALAKARGES